MAQFKGRPDGGPSGTEMIGLGDMSAGVFVEFLVWYWPTILGLTAVIALAMMGRRRLVFLAVLATAVGQIARLYFAS